MESDSPGYRGIMGNPTMWIGETSQIFVRDPTLQREGPRALADEQGSLCDVYGDVVTLRSCMSFLGIC